MTFRIDATIPMTVSADLAQFGLDIGQPQAVTLGVAAAVKPIAGEKYTGAYTVTPSASEQHLATAGLVMDYDVTVAPIPNNYGLITWNGSTLTVS